jgi:hypothetical protein
LEAACLDAIRAAAANAWACMEPFDACLSVNGTAPLQAWPSSLPTPGLRLGEAAQKGLLLFDAPAFAPSSEFLRRLWKKLKNRKITLASISNIGTIRCHGLHQTRKH